MKSRLKLLDIRLVWDRVKPPIVDLITEWELDFKPEDIYAQCLMGRAFCYVCEDGFIIVRPQENQFNLKKELFVWICYSQHNNGLVEYRSDIMAIAKDVYATEIVFMSPRDGFKKLAERENWKVMTEYRMPVNLQ
ncbi:MAG: hypothetical protein ACXV8O_01375 [Methylobacter sp.]